MRKFRRKAGDVVLIQIEGNYFAARLYHESIGVLKKVFDVAPTLSEVIGLPVAFFGYCVDMPIANGAWPKIGVWQFSDSEDPWAPPTYRKRPSSPPVYFRVHGLEKEKIDRDQTLGMQQFVLDCSQEDFERRVLKHLNAGDFD